MSERVVSTSIPYIPLTVSIPERRYRADFTALLDTGFNAEAVVPQSAELSGAALLYSDVRLADGSRITVPSYLGNVQIGDTTIGPLLVMVMGDEAIIGLQIITRFTVTIDHDRSLTLEP